MTDPRDKDFSDVVHGEDLEFRESVEPNFPIRHKLSALSMPPPQLLLNLLEYQLVTLAGAASGFAAGVAVCPLDVVKTRLQAQGAFLPGKSQINVKYKGFVGAFKTILHEEGIRGLYRGLVPITIGYLPTWTIYFTIYERAKAIYPDILARNFNIHTDAVNHFLSAITAGTASSIAANPIWVVKTRLMIQTGANQTIYGNTSPQTKPERTYYKGTLHAFKTMYKEEGLGVFYKGLVPSLFGLAHVGIHFPVYEKLKLALHCEPTPESKGLLWRLILASSISKMIASTITYPHEILRTRMQIQGSHEDRNKRVSMVSTIKRIYRKEGLKGFYAGYVINLARTVPASAVTLVSFEYFKTYLLELTEGPLHNRDLATGEIGTGNPEQYEEDEPSPVADVDVELPALLTEDDFDTSTKEQLSFVEFYSPYCSHCKEFFPTWEKTYKEFHKELKKLKIQMRQVNCVESGDLCNREDIDAYPNLRIYSPNKGEVEGLKFVESFPRTVVRTPDNLKKFMKNAVAEYDSGAIDLPSSSKLLDTDEILKVVAGDISEAHFVMFYPATAKQIAETEATSKNMFDSPCIDCMEMKQTWDKLSNRILATVKSGHVACYDNPTICKELGFKSLSDPGARGSRYKIPRFVMFLPNETGIVRMDYNGKPILSELKAFSDRLYENSQYERITSRGLSEVMDFRMHLPSSPLSQYYPLPSKVSVVFFFDIDTVTEEDRAILPYLLDVVTKSPFNVHLYTAKHVKIPRDIQEQSESLIDYINYDSSARYSYDRAMFLSSALTSKPTIYIFRDYALFTSTFQTFAPEDLRDYKKVEEFVVKNQFPLYGELTPELLPHYFNTDPSQKSDKVVVTFIESTDAKLTNDHLYNISLAAHEYYYNRRAYHYGSIVDQRADKANRVKQLEEANADSAKIIKEMSKEIPHFFEQSEVLFTFVDVTRKDEFKQVNGWDINIDDYQVGDTIILSKDNRYFWDQNIKGHKLRNDPHAMKPVLMSFLDPKFAVGSKISRQLVGSPYGGVLSFMDYVHDRGFLGYVGFIGAIYVCLTFAKKFQRRRHRGSGGILGNLEKKD
ncbi:uncharacterized protein CANTADRAFT_4367 [Suhomyces tanzawaensis NRRL Y-17324]|uniref:Mitochondrial thiamine pyrophosphate carrier 1 n=1 Tax=Suhomyces tanzawaensis NRRL Y-17324 TaxID=984487 RepID=A0A1E4SS69_9ASCO|nr:uncharacterized protein CANTADRAFT_4367 [Suhomyces tanzawaensis NRRL Y-17324]ODV82360.1 hypothetical protein CANTADRAFT_4367 [Suhomyces tanzawaensis NRRL Y-17324]